MNASNQPLTGSARAVVQGIDSELERLAKLEQALVSERALLLAARAALMSDGRVKPRSRHRLSHSEIAAYLKEHPGSSAAEIAQALQATATAVTSLLHRANRSRYDSRADGWHVRESNGSRPALHDSPIGT